VAFSNPFEVQRLRTICGAKDYIFLRNNAICNLTLFCNMARMSVLLSAEDKSMSGRKTHHVVPNSGGGWDVKRGSSERASKHFDTKKEAETWGREVSRNQKTEFIVHRKDGSIERADSHGNDPITPKDKK
jgi:hypothetical protein